MVKNPVLLKDDPLGFVFNYHQILCQGKKSKIIVLGLFLTNFFFAIYVSFYLWKDNGAALFFRRYTVIFFLAPWIFAVLTTETFVVQPSIKKIEMKKCWDIETVSSSMRPKLNANIRIQRFAFMWYILQSVMAGFIFPLIGQIYGHIAYSDIQYIMESSSVSILLKVVMYLFFHMIHLIAAFYAIAAYILLKYLVQSVALQLNILANYIQQTNGYRDDDHSSIKNHLRICAIHHILLLRIFKVIQGVAYLPFLYMLFFGQLVLLCCSIYLYYNRHPLDLLQIGSILFMSYVLAMDCCQGGQDVTDAFDEVTLNLLGLRWYNWNAVNKKVLLVILSRTQKDEKMVTLGLCFDRTLMVKILKFAYQAMLIFYKMTHDQ